MKALLVMIFVGLEISFAFIFILGWGHSASRRLIGRAVGALRENNFKAARTLVLQATRLNGNLLRNEEVKTLYDAILSQDQHRAHLELDRIEATATSWPAHWIEKFNAHPVPRFVFFGLLLLAALLRLANLF